MTYRIDDATESHERAVQVNLLRFALEDIARTSACPRSAARARRALEQVPAPYQHPMEDAE